jgi:hypothetical protein
MASESKSDLATISKELVAMKSLIETQNKKIALLVGIINKMMPPCGKCDDIGSYMEVRFHCGKRIEDWRTCDCNKTKQQLKEILA